MIPLCTHHKYGPTSDVRVATWVGTNCQVSPVPQPRMQRVQHKTFRSHCPHPTGPRGGMLEECLTSVRAVLPLALLLSPAAREPRSAAGARGPRGEGRGGEGRHHRPRCRAGATPSGRRGRYLGCPPGLRGRRGLPRPSRVRAGPAPRCGRPSVQWWDWAAPPSPWLREGDLADLVWAPVKTYRSAQEQSRKASCVLGMTGKGTENPTTLLCLCMCKLPSVSNALCCSDSSSRTPHVPYGQWV